MISTQKKGKQEATRSTSKKRIAKNRRKTYKLNAKLYNRFYKKNRQRNKHRTDEFLRKNKDTTTEAEKTRALQKKYGKEKQQTPLFTIERTLELYSQAVEEHVVCALAQR